MVSSKHPSRKLNKFQIASLIYHDKYDYPLTKSELYKWQLNTYTNISNTKYYYKNNYYYLAGKKNNINLRLKREKYSKKKLLIAKKASNLLSKIPSIKLIAITGSLAMSNSDKNSDIDLMIITKQNTLWTTRLISFMLLKFAGFKLRRAGDTDEKDKLCLNMWLDERDIVIRKRNIYTAHELAQTMPIYNKLLEHERILTENRWIFNFWPNAVVVNNKINTTNITNQNNIYIKLISICESLAYSSQRRYMKNKVTNETITKTRAFFHPRVITHSKH